MTDPDVRHAGWAIGGPNSRMRRRRNPVWLALALIVALAGLAAVVYGIFHMVTEGTHAATTSWHAG